MRRPAQHRSSTDQPQPWARPWGLPRHPTGFHRRARRDESGSVSVEMMVLLPVVMLIIGMVFQTALLFHAQHTISVAAEEAVESGKIDGATAADARKGANDVLSQTGALRNITVTVDRGTDVVTVTVTGDAPTLLGSWQVTSTAQSPTERFIPPEER